MDGMSECYRYEHYDPRDMNGSWRKSSHSYGDCVEARAGTGGVEVRDSKNPGGLVLSYTPAEWEAFLHGVKRGEFDSLVTP